MRYYICLVLYAVLTTAYFTSINLPHLLERIHEDVSPKDTASYQVTAGGEPMQVLLLVSFAFLVKCDYPLSRIFAVGSQSTIISNRYFLHLRVSFKAT